VSIDFKELYGQEELKKLIRHYKCDENGVDIVDEFEIEGDGSFVERLVTYFEPKISDGMVEVDGVLIKFDSKIAKATYTVDMRARELNEDGSIKVGEDVYCIDITPFELGTSFSFRVEVKK
jgi:hypothetical protein